MLRNHSRILSFTSITSYDMRRAGTGSCHRDHRIKSELISRSLVLIVGALSLQ